MKAHHPGVGPGLVGALVLEALIHRDSGFGAYSRELLRATLSRDAGRSCQGARERDLLLIGRKVESVPKRKATRGGRYVMITVTAD